MRKAPPQTVPNKERLIKRFNPAVDIEVWLEILPDGTDSSVHGAVTHFEMGGVSWLTPGYNWRPRGGRKIVTAINGRFEMKGVITIQTLYGLSSSPTDLSLYGRGTTPRDKAAGNVTLGFHEHCHRVDFRRYLKKNPLPRFRARTGMTEEAFLRAGNQLDRAMRAYSRKMKEASDRRTDEVGYTRAQCRRDGKC